MPVLTPLSPCQTTISFFSLFFPSFFTRHSLFLIPVCLVLASFIFLLSTSLIFILYLRLALVFSPYFLHTYLSVYLSISSLFCLASSLSFCIFNTSFLFVYLYIQFLFSPLCHLLMVLLSPQHSQASPCIHKTAICQNFSFALASC